MKSMFRAALVSVMVCASAGCGGAGSDDGAAPGSDASAPAIDGGPRADAAGPGRDAGTDAARDASSDDAAVSDAAVDGPELDAGADAPSINDDPFDPASCDGLALSAADALAKLGGAARAKLADATLMRRTRTCADADPANCGPWTVPVAHTQALLTYSGGVVTDYKTFSFPTHLVLWSQAGTPKMSVRHASDFKHDATASARGVAFAFGADPMVNTYPIIYVWDFAPAPNRYDDLQGLLGQRAELHASATCARLVVTSGLTQEIAALYRY